MEASPRKEVCLYLEETDTGASYICSKFRTSRFERANFEKVREDKQAALSQSRPTGGAYDRNDGWCHPDKDSGKLDNNRSPPDNNIDDENITSIWSLVYYKKEREGERALIDETIARDLPNTTSNPKGNGDSVDPTIFVSNVCNLTEGICNSRRQERNMTSECKDKAQPSLPLLGEEGILKNEGWWYLEEEATRQSPESHEMPMCPWTCPQPGREGEREQSVISQLDHGSGHIELYSEHCFKFTKTPSLNEW